jgi:hypothetical protein
MPTLKWTKLTEPDFEISARDIIAPWFLVVAAMRDYTHLQIRAEGSWAQADGIIGPCDPDGLPGLPLQADRLLVADCQVGALVRKARGQLGEPLGRAERGAVLQPVGRIVDAR